MDIMRSEPNAAEPSRQQTTSLAEEYRAIGPAALVAALICAAKKGQDRAPEKRAA